MNITLIAGVIGIGLVHGVLPDHGWPIAATYALRQRRRFAAGAIAAIVIGVGHLLSSLALVAAFLLLADTLALHETRWLPMTAGALLVALGVWELLGVRSGHSHHHHHDHDHEHHGGGWWAGLHQWVHARLGSPAERGLVQLATVAILLGVAHEEPIQILAICAGTSHCLALMVIYSLAVIVALLVPTLLLIAGYERHQALVERHLPHLSIVTAVILIAMGGWFLVGG